MELDKIERENAQDWHPRGETAEELHARARALLKQDLRMFPEVSGIKRHERTLRIISTNKPLRS